MIFSRFTASFTMKFSNWFFSLSSTLIKSISATLLIILVLMGLVFLYYSVAAAIMSYLHSLKLSKFLLAEAFPLI